MKRMAVALLVGGASLAASAVSTPAPDVEPRIIVRRVPNNGIQPQARVDRNGVLHLLYFAGEARAGDLFYVRSTDLGAIFSTPVRVNAQPGSAIATGAIRGGRLALGRGGVIHVVWNGSDAAIPRGVVNPHTGRATAPLLYARSNTGGTTFTPERNLMRASYDLDGGADVTANDAGDVYAVWHANGTSDPAGEASRRIWIARSADDGATFAPERAVAGAKPGVCGCCAVSALATRSSRLDLLFRSAADPTTRDIHLLASDDSGLTARGSLVQPWGISACPMSSMSMVETAAGEAAAWETAGQVYYGIVDRTRSAIPTTVAPPGPATGRKHPRLAATADGRMLLVWTEGTAWARGGSLAWQAFNSNGNPAGPPGSAPGVPTWSFGAAVAATTGDFVLLY